MGPYYLLQSGRTYNNEWADQQARSNVFEIKNMLTLSKLPLKCKNLQINFNFHYQLCKKQFINVKSSKNETFLASC